MREVRLRHPELPPEQTIPGFVTDDGRVIPNLADAGWVVEDDAAPETPALRPDNNEQGASSLETNEGE